MIFIESTYHKMRKNNDPNGGIDGIYSYFYIENNNGTYDLMKYTIVYQCEYDEDLCDDMEHDNAIKYYILFYSCEECKKQYKVPAPAPCQPYFDSELKSLFTDKGFLFPTWVNKRGSFYAVYSSEARAKKAACEHLMGMIYPYTYILSEEETAEWNSFLKCTH